MPTRKDLVGTVTSTTLALCALIITALVVRREFTPRTPGTAQLQTQIDDWRDYSSSGSLIGPANAPITIVVFSDFECPFCAQLAERLQAARKKFPGAISVRFRQMPLTEIHANAMSAAVAVECAGRQGRFEQYHDVLFAQQKAIGVRSWHAFAKDAGVVDSMTFATCMTDSTVTSPIQRDIAAAGRLELSGTPAILVNDRLFRGAPTQQQLGVMIERALKETR